jgi:hypothetical protein
MASRAYEQSRKCGASAAKQILAEAARRISAMGDQYAVEEICDLAISLRVRSHRIRIPRREVRKITDIPMGILE